MRDKVDQGMQAYLGELRHATVIFVNLKGMVLNVKGASGTDGPHTALLAMQEVVSHNAGYLRQFLVDDKGTVLIVVFGVPPYSWEDNAYRAVKTAMELREALMQAPSASGCPSPEPAGRNSSQDCS